MQGDAKLSVLVPGPGMSEAEEARMLRENEGLVQKVARSLVKDTHLLDDALQEARLTMLAATRKFDAGRGIPWSAYIAQAMRWEIIHWLGNSANTVRVPIRAWYKGRRAPMVSMDAPLGGEGDSSFLLDTLVAAEGELGLSDEAGQVERLWAVVDRLPEKMRNVVRWRFEQGLTLEAAGELMGVTRERIRQIEALALRKLSYELKEGADGLTGAAAWAAAKVRAQGLKLVKPKRVSVKAAAGQGVTAVKGRSDWRKRVRLLLQESAAIENPKISNLTERTTMTTNAEVSLTWEPLEEEAVPGMAKMGYMVSLPKGEKNGVLRVYLCAEMVKDMKLKHGDLLRLDGAVEARKGRLTQGTWSKPGRAIRKLGVRPTGRGEWRIPYTGAIKDAFPLMREITELKGVVVTKEGVEFELPVKQVK